MSNWSSGDGPGDGARGLGGLTVPGSAMMMASAFDDDRSSPLMKHDIADSDHAARAKRELRVSLFWRRPAVGAAR